MSREYIIIHVFWGSNPIGSMGLEYLPTNLPNKNQPNVGKHIIHGSFGLFYEFSLKHGEFIHHEVTLRQFFTYSNGFQRKNSSTRMSTVLSKWIKNITPI